MALWKRIGGENWFINPRKTKRHKKNKGGTRNVAKRRRRHSYRRFNRPRAKVKYRTRTVTKIRYRNKPKRRVNRRRRHSMPRFPFLRRHNPPLFLGRHFGKRHRRRRNPKFMGSFRRLNFKTIAAIAVGLLAPSFGKQIFPYFRFTSKVANFALGVAYAGVAMLAAKYVFKATPAFTKTVLYAGFAGAAVSIWGDVLTQNQLLSSLSPSKLLPSASPAASSYYYQGALSAAQLNDEVLSQPEFNMGIY